MDDSDAKMEKYLALKAKREKLVAELYPRRFLVSRVERERSLSYLCCVCGHFCASPARATPFTEATAVLPGPRLDETSLVAPSMLSQMKMLCQPREPKQTNGKEADRVTHGSVRVPYDTRRVRYQVPARWIASCLLASVLQDASRSGRGCGQN